MTFRTRHLGVLAILAGVAGGLSLRTATREPTPRTRRATAPQANPVLFEEDRGQTGGHPFLARGADFWAVGDGRTLEIHPADLPRAVRLAHLGASSGARCSLEQPSLTRTNYFVAGQALTNVANYERVRCVDLYPGVDFVAYSAEGALEFDYVLHPGTDPSVIQLRSDAPTQLAAGDLQLAPHVTLRAPVVYEVNEARERVPLRASYEFDEGVIRFAVADHQPTRALVIDPVLAFSTNLPGNQSGIAVGLDTAGNTYFAAMRDGAPTPALVNALYTDDTQASTGTLITRYSPTGQVMYRTLFFEPSTDVYAVAFDANGAAIVAGRTKAFDNPSTRMVEPTFPLVNAAQMDHNQNAGQPGVMYTDAFLSKVAPDGSALAFSTIWGGGVNDGIYRLAIDSQNNIYALGMGSGDNTFSPATEAFPTVASWSTPPANFNGPFLAKFSPSGTVQLSTPINLSDISPLAQMTNCHFAADNQGGVYIYSDLDAISAPTLTVPGLTNGPTLLHFTATGQKWSRFVTQRVGASFGAAVAATAAGDAIVSGLLDGNAGDAGNDCPWSSGLNGSYWLYRGKVRLDAGVDVVRSTCQGYDVGSSTDMLQVDGNGDIWAATKANIFQTEANLPGMKFLGPVAGDVLLMHFGPNLAFKDAYAWGGTLDEIPRALATNANGDVAVGGYGGSPDVPQKNPDPTFDAGSSGANHDFVFRLAAPTVVSAVVTNTNASGAGSFAAAVNAANGAPGTTVTFKIPKSDPHYSAGTVLLPAVGVTITATGTVIDTASQSTFLGEAVSLGFQGDAGTGTGLTVKANNVTVTGLSFLETSTGLEVNGASGVKVTGCSFGATGAGNGVGLVFRNGAKDAVVGGTGTSANRFIGNTVGVRVTDATTSGITLWGNEFNGVAPSVQTGVEVAAGATGTIIGSTDLGLANRFVDFGGSSSVNFRAIDVAGPNTVVRGNVFGAIGHPLRNVGRFSAAADDSLFAKNQVAAWGDGLRVNGAKRVKIQGNTFGPAATSGLSAAVTLGSTTDARIGGSAPGEGNEFPAIAADATTAKNVSLDTLNVGARIEGNTFGDENQKSMATHISIANANEGTVVGGPGAARNVIAGAVAVVSDKGARLENNLVALVSTLVATNFQLVGNEFTRAVIPSVRIPGPTFVTLADSSNVTLTGNSFAGETLDTSGKPAGVYVSAQAAPSALSQITIGGMGKGNTFKKFTGPGVVVNGGITGVKISENSIDTSGLGIDLDFDGVTPNDALDADTGTNELLNAPVVQRITTKDGVSHVVGSWNSSENTLATIEVFSNSQCGALSGDARSTLHFLGRGAVQTNANGVGAFDITINGPADSVTAVAYDTLGNTSEVSACVLNSDLTTDAVTPGVAPPTAVSSNADGTIPDLGVLAFSLAAPPVEDLNVKSVQATATADAAEIVEAFVVVADTNGNGVWDEGEPEVGRLELGQGLDALKSVIADAGDVTKNTTKNYIVVAKTKKKTARRDTAPVYFGLGALPFVWLLRRGRVTKHILAMSALLALALACGNAPQTKTRKIQFTLTAVDAAGATTGRVATVPGLPLAGPEITVK